MLCFCVLFLNTLENLNIFSPLCFSVGYFHKSNPFNLFRILIFYKEIKITVLTVLFSAVLMVGIPVLLTNLDFVLSNYKHYLDIFILHRTTNFSESNLHSGYSLTMFLSKYFGKYALIVSTALSLVYLFIKQLREKVLSPLVLQGIFCAYCLFLQ